MVWQGLLMRLLIGKPEIMFADLWCLDLDTNEWRDMTPQIAPAEDLAIETTLNVSRFQAAAIGTKIWIHTHRCKDHLLCLDTATLSLSKHPLELRPLQPAKGHPGGRGLHTMNAVGSELYILGGIPQNGQSFGDMWVVDTSKLEDGLTAEVHLSPRALYILLHHRSPF